MVAAALVLTLFLGACASKPPIAESRDQFDTAESQVERGELALEQGRLAEALEAFTRANSLDPNNIDAYAGLVRVNTLNGNFAAGRDALEAGKARVGNDAQRRRFAVLEINLLASQPGTDWYDDAQDVADTELGKRAPKNTDGQVQVAIGKAGLRAYEVSSEQDFLEDADGYLRQAVAGGGQSSAEANLLLQRVDDLFRAGAGPAAQISAKPALTKEDVVVLLFKEFDLDAFLPGQDLRTPKPGETTADGTSDYAHLPIRNEIRKVHRLGLRPLRIIDGSFDGDSEMSREGFAMLLEDLMILKTGDRSIARRYIGSESPYSDVAKTRPGFNAVMAAVGRNLMRPRPDSTFAPTAPISGADAVYGLRNLRLVDGMGQS